ncbi:hypothetical protein VWM48_09640, partial [Campylobacter coli]
FQGGVHPKLKIEWYEALVSWIKEHYPNITVHGFSAVEIAYIAYFHKSSTTFFKSSLLSPACKEKRILAVFLGTVGSFIAGAKMP